MNRYLRVYTAFLRNCLAKELEYRTSFILRAVGNLAHGAVSLLFLSLVFRHVQAIAGWTINQGILLMGTFLLFQGILGFIFSENMERISSYVNRGELDFILTKPISSQFYVSTRLISWDNLPRILLGVAVILYALRQLGSVPTPAQVALYLILLITGLVIGYSLWFLSIIYVFWTERLRNAGFIFHSFTELGRIPIQAFKGISRYLLTFVLPIAFMTTTPTESLLGIVTLSGTGTGLFLATILFLCANRMWRVGLRAYSSASS
ncbi:MAG: ABC-2 family transporter protein [Candidatus Latescibacteria bacterium]|nr:ABC-2 family transporter protein [Candidatus Latescibacterota bacterium]